MTFLEVLYYVVGIFGGVMTGLNGMVVLVEKYKSYIERGKETKEKDPSACLAASDGLSGDCEKNR